MFIAGTIFSQEQIDPRKWSIDPRLTSITATSQPLQIPQAKSDYIHKNTTTRVIYSPNEILAITPNIRVHPSTTTWQSEVPITRHPTNGNILYASSNAVHFGPVFISEGMYLSTDGGATWFGSDTTTSSPVGSHSGDPAPAIGPDGRLYMSMIISGGMGVTYSTNMGTTWASNFTLATGSQDKNHTFVNDVPASPYYGRSYVTWSLFTASAPPAVVSWSSNGGVNWNGPVNVLTPPSGHYQQGVNGAVGANGDAYICWQNPTTSSPFTGDFVGFAKSTDGGVTWSGLANAYDCNGIRGTLAAKGGIRTNDFPSMAVDRSGGPRNGWIYVVTAEQNLAPAGTDPDIIMHRSTNGGTTWSSGIRVNQDGLSNGKIQYMPWMCVDASGGLNVVYYDDRVTTSDSATVFVSRSLDGGTTWTDIEVSDHRFKPAPIPGLAGGYQGDYIGITAAGGKVYPYWCDNSTGIYQAWVTSVVTTENFGWVKGIVTNASSGSPLSGVTVDFTDPISQAPATSDGTGFFKAGAKVDTPATTRNVTLRARKFGFRDTLINVTIIRNDTITRNFAMTPLVSGTLVVRTVRTDSTNIASLVTIRFAGSVVDTGTTSASTGILSRTLPAGSYDITIDPPSPFGTRQFNAVVVNSSATTPLYVVVRKVVENTPAAMRDTLAVSQIHAKTLTLTNTTNDTIPYRLNDDNALAGLKARFSKPAVQAPLAPEPEVFLPKNFKDTRSGGAQLNGAGGPDAFGYRWIDSDEPGGPTFNWVDIKSVGTQVTTWNVGTGDDGYATLPTFPGGFSFPFYGNTYTNLSISTNGNVQFGTTPSTQYINDGIPTTAVPNNAVYAFWDDLDVSTAGGGTIWYYYDAANTRFIVQWDTVSHYLAGSEPGRYSVQVMLKPNGEVLCQYKTMIGTLSSATIGLENAAGTVALRTVFNAAYIHNNMAIRFYLPDAGWMSENPSLGRINPNTSQNITVTFDANGLLQGTTYNANIVMDVTHPDVSGSISIPASLRIISASGPLIIVARTSVTFPATEIGTTSRDSVTVRNGGSATLNLTSVTTSNSRFIATATSSAIAPGDSARIRIAYNPVASAGNDTGRVIVLSNDLTLPRVDITLNGTSIRLAHIFASPDSFYFSRPQGTDTTTASLKIKNTGTDTLRYNITEALRGLERPALQKFQRNGPVSFSPLSLPKGAVDHRVGLDQINGAGGPDAFGYRWIDSDEPGGPAFNWVDISTTGTALDSVSAWVLTGTFTGGDEGYYPVLLPFSFSFYGVNKDTVFIGSNGNIMFQRPTGNSFTNAAFPTTGDAANNHVGVWWDDLQVRAGAKVYYGTSGGNFVVQFQGVALYNATVGNYTFEVILSPGGMIKMQYLSMGYNGGTLISSSIGIENSSASIGLGTVFNAAYMHNNLAIVYTSDILPWLTTDRTSGTIAPGDSQNVQVRVVPNQTPGTYTGHLTITGNTSDTKTVGVRLDVTAAGNSITVTSPNGGEVWNVGSTYPITWVKAGAVDTVRIEYSTNGPGGPWNQIAAGNPAKPGILKDPKPDDYAAESGKLDNPNGTYNWLVPAGTATANCYIRVSWKSNLAVNDLSNSAFTIQQTGGGDTTVLVTLTSGWNLISTPVVRTLNTDSVKQLYPTSLNNYAFEFVGGIGYVQRFTMRNGPGFWEKFPSSTVDSIRGAARILDSISVVAGWNLVGSISFPVDTATIVSIPPGIRSSFWFGYPYTAAPRIVPGKGFWVKTTSPGKFIFQSSGPVESRGQAPNSLAELNELTIMDSSGATQTLYFGANMEGVFPLSQYDMPPMPPASAFDARFESSQGGRMVQLHGAEAGDMADFPIKIQTDSYPVAVSWKINSGYGIYALADGSNVAGFGPKILMGDGDMKIASNAVHRLVLQVRGGEDAIPKEYALSQNYPNPFNPATRIKYQLPRMSHVTLRVFDVLGREVETLIDRVEDAGYKSVEFDASRFASGVFFYQINAGDFSVVRKMLVLK